MEIISATRPTRLVILISSP